MPAARLIIGNCVEVMESWPEGCVDLMVTSPPYDQLRDYKGYDFDSKQVITALFRVIRPGGVVVWVVGDTMVRGSRTLTSFRHAVQFRQAGFNVHDVMLYQKKNTPFSRKNAYTNCYEFVFVCSKGAPYAFNPLRVPVLDSSKYKVRSKRRNTDGSMSDKVRETFNTEKIRTNIWSYAVGLHGTTNDKMAFEHPALFPEKLAADHIVSWSNPGDLVVDPMCGASTTGKMALMNDRRYVGIDVSEEYIEISRRRLTEHGFRVPVRRS